MAAKKHILLGVSRWSHSIILKSFQLTFAMPLQYSALVISCQEDEKDENFLVQKLIPRNAARAHSSQELAAQSETFAAE